MAATFDGKMLTTYRRRADCVVIDPPLEEYLHTQGDLCVGGTLGKAMWDATSTRCGCGTAASRGRRCARK